MPFPFSCRSLDYMNSNTLTWKSRDNLRREENPQGVRGGAPPQRGGETGMKGTTPGEGKTLNEGVWETAVPEISVELGFKFSGSWRPSGPGKPAPGGHGAGRGQSLPPGLVWRPWGDGPKLLFGRRCGSRSEGEPLPRLEGGVFIL